MDGDLKQQCKLFIGGLHWKTQDSDLKDYFSKMGTVTDAMVSFPKLYIKPLKIIQKSFEISDLVSRRV